MTDSWYGYDYPTEVPSVVRDGDAVVFWHDCTGDVAESNPLPARLHMGPSGWRVTEDDPLSVMPSILCRGCGLHGFWTAGVWHGC